MLVLPAKQWTDGSQSVPGQVRQNEETLSENN
jgi:hypothetical protein